MSNYPGNYGQPGYNQPSYGQGYQARPSAPGYQPGYQRQPGPTAPGGYGQGFPAAQGYQQRPPGHQGMQGYPAQPGYPTGPPPGLPHGMPAPPPGADPTLWNWFITVDVDKSGEITAIELKQALINGNWTQFNDETCRLMISMFDRDQSGTISFTEFCDLWKYIQQWKGVFDRYDRDRSGAIEMNELQTALNEMGYRVSPNFVHLLITRFDTVARRSMKLDSFIQCCVMLRLLTDAFRMRDANQNGVINVSYEDFMCMVIENKA
ncbi:programmed cell death protein 6-like [Dendronephthya gigantea]|uniref:programmed cell death protein 6-like n=1 Tax=Dendronephthya gigantea TaxID=151771 RepID=UPI00106CA714|nr:programmed cell death protein 6-like [Dendronephthya gigantea]